MTDTILRLPAVIAHTGLKKTAIYDGVKKGTFPTPLRVGIRATGWKASDLDLWMASRPRTDA